MTRWDVILGGGTLAVLAALTVSVVRSVREVLAVEKERRRRLPLVVAGAGQSDGARHAAPGPGVAQGAGGFLPAVGPSRMPFGGPQEQDDPTAYLDDEIAATARRIIRDQGLIP